MYESVIDLVGGQATMLFVELHYTLATEEAERIGVDHVARMSSNEAGESSLGELTCGSCCDQVLCNGYHSSSYSGEVIVWNEAFHGFL
jgi:hypothetical protein